MAKFEIAVDPGITEAERTILDAKRSVIFATIFGRSLRWSVIEHAEQKRFFRLTDFHDLHRCYLEMHIEDIAACPDFKFKDLLVVKALSTDH